MLCLPSYACNEAVSNVHSMEVKKWEMKENFLLHNNEIVLIVSPASHQVLIPAKPR